MSTLRARAREIGGKRHIAWRTFHLHHTKFGDEFMCTSQALRGFWVSSVNARQLAARVEKGSASTAPGDGRSRSAVSAKFKVRNETRR